VVITVVALIFGLRVPPANLLLALIVLAMMVLFGVSISFALAIFVPNETLLGNLTNGVAQPLSLLAGVLIPLSVAPLWVRRVALWNPFAWGANGMQKIFEGHIGAPVVWQAGIILAGLATVALVLSSRLFTREIA
jgi:ABC-2 type transport system permease protein